MLCEKCGGRLSPQPELSKPATLTGNWFMRLGEDGQPEVAGCIARGLGRGRYLLTYSFVKPGVKVEPVLDTDQMTYLQWLLFDSAAAWRESFFAASR